MKKILAFTLAETLIVMGVIGVVAALTLPNLNQSTNNKEKIAKVKKIYSNLNDAVGRATAVYGPINEWSGLNKTKFFDRTTEFMKLSKTDRDNVTAILADGTELKVLASDADTSIYVYNVDIDGNNKGKNSPGYDIFQFQVDKSTNEVKPHNIVNRCGTFSDLLRYKNVCGSTWIINYDTMDYLKLDGNGQCPNGTTPTETNPTCN